MTKVTIHITFILALVLFVLSYFFPYFTHKVALNIIYFCFVPIFAYFLGLVYILSSLFIFDVSLFAYSISYWFIYIFFVITLAIIFTAPLIMLYVNAIMWVCKKVSSFSHIKIDLVLKGMYSVLVYSFSLVTFVLSFVPLFFESINSPRDEGFFFILPLFIAGAHKKIFDLFKNKFDFHISSVSLWVKIFLGVVIVSPFIFWSIQVIVKL